jgi:hypothetical protein
MGSTVSSSGQGNILDISGGSVEVISGTATVNGSANNIAVSSNETVSIEGSSNTSTVAGTGNSVEVTGNNNTSTSPLSGNAVTLDGTDNKVESSGSPSFGAKFDLRCRGTCQRNYHA